MNAAAHARKNAEVLVTDEIPLQYKPASWSVAHSKTFSTVEFHLYRLDYYLSGKFEYSSDIDLIDPRTWRITV